MISSTPLIFVFGIFVQEKILEEDDRCLAETHYQLGLAHSFSDDFDKAIHSFAAAIKVIEQRIENLIKKKKEKESWTEEQRTKDGEIMVVIFLKHYQCVWASCHEMYIIIIIMVMLL